ncbi:MAG: MerC domain-containing protein [Balneolaceae bacterium]
MPEKSITTTLLWDRLGIGVSGICAIHCLLFPIIISILPLWPLATTLHDWTHPVFIVLLLPTIYFAARRSHYSKKITLPLFLGFVLVIFGWLLGHFWYGAGVETTLTLLGSAILIVGHWLNFRHHRVCKNKNHQHHPLSGDTETSD